jgi:probable rRNA maturation factor
MILNRQRAVRVAMRPLELFLERVQRELKVGEAEVTVCLVSDREIAGMNEEFRKKKGPTDVLSFPATDASGPVRRRSAKRLRRRNGTGVAGKSFLGDIAIAPGVAKRNAKSLGRTPPEELRILVLHGVLHLLGYDHETDRGEMDRIEQRMRRRLGLA